MQQYLALMGHSKIKVKTVLTNFKMNIHAIFWPSFVIASYSFEVSNITATFYVIHTVPDMTHNTQYNICTVWYTIHEKHIKSYMFQHRGATLKKSL